MIDTLPSTAQDAYEKILSRVSENQKGSVKKLLQIVVGARRPLTLQEMAVALGIATSKQPKSLDEVMLNPTRLKTQIRRGCGLFVFLNHNRIYLIHQTAKEFLIGCSSSTFPLAGWKYSFDLRDIEKEMTRICVEFLRLEDVEPTTMSLVQKIEGKLNNKLDEIMNKNNYVECFAAYSAEH